MQRILKAGRTSGRLEASAPSKRGFVLLDVVLALAVLGLVMLIAWPHQARGTGAARHAAYALEIAALLKNDRTAAAQLGHNVATGIDVSARRIVSGSTGRAIVLPADLQLDVLASGICISAPGKFAITFSEDGRSCGAVVRIAKGDRDWRVRINWLSGQIDVIAPQS